MSTDDTDAILDDWIEALATALDIPVDAIDRDAVLGLAGNIAHAVVRPAAPLTTYLVGYAAGRADARAEADGFASAAATARDLAATP